MSTYRVVDHVGTVIAKGCSSAGAHWLASQGPRRSVEPECEVNVAGREEDCGGQVAYRACREMAVAEARSPYCRAEFYVCEAHAEEIESECGSTGVYRFGEERAS